MRPLFWRWQPQKLEIARQVVSRAEREALLRAETLSMNADQLFRDAELRAAEAERKARDEVLYAVKAEMFQAREQSDQILKRARAEAEELITTAIASIEENIAYSAAAREQQERELAVAQQMRVEAETELEIARQTRQTAAQCLAEAQTEAIDMASEVEERCHRLVMAAREAAEAEYIAARQELARDIASMRDAMAMTWSTLEGFLSAANVTTPHPSAVAVSEQPVADQVFDGPDAEILEGAQAEVEALMGLDIELRVPISAA
jgi:hypothetical protein